jgi:hypothetical protein
MDSVGDLSWYHHEGGIGVGILNRRHDLDSVGATFMVARRGSP